MGYSDEEMYEEWEGDNFDEYTGDDLPDEETGLLIYTEETQHKIICCRPENWWIPTDKDLRAVEQTIFD
jgi:hypothetical protein